MHIIDNGQVLHSTRDMLHFIAALSCRNRCNSSSTCRNYKNTISVRSCNKEILKKREKSTELNLIIC